MAVSLFWSCERSSWQVTTMPVGMWMSRTAVEVFWTFWPPAPEERKTSIFTSSGFTCTSRSASTSGITSTRAKDVCRRCAASKGESRTSRWTPRSDLEIAVGVGAP